MMSGIDEKSESNEPYLRILYFSNLDVLVRELGTDNISSGTVVFVKKPIVDYTAWHHIYLNVRRAARTGGIFLINTYDELRELFTYQDAGKMYMLW